MNKGQTGQLNADIVLKTKTEPKDWTYSLQGSIDSVLVNSNQVVYRNDFDLLKSELTASEAARVELQAELFDVHLKADKEHELNQAKITELETRCRELEKQLIIEIKSHLPIYAPEYVAKEMLKNRLDELSAITIDSIKGDQK